MTSDFIPVLVLCVAVVATFGLIRLIDKLKE